jgi:hypothetical protein
VEDREYVEVLLEALRQHMDAATLWDGKVNRRVANIKILYENLTEAQMRKKFEVDYDLNDRLAKYRYHCGEVQRYSAMIQGIAAAQTYLAQRGV